MKRKVKRYDEGGILTDRYGNAVRSSSGEPVKTRYGSSSEDRPKSSGVDDYESMGKRAGATSPFSGPKEYIKESIEEESPKSSSEPDSVAGKGAENLAFEPDAETVVKKKTVIKKKAPAYKEKDPSSILESAAKRKSTYEDTGAKIGSQGDFKMKPAVPQSISGMGPKNTFLTKERMGVKDTSSGSFMDRVKEHLGNEFKTKKMASGGKTSTASSRGDGIAQRGKTRGRMC
jgi:hypothetical protein